jgi:hypothetical protein
MARTVNMVPVLAHGAGEAAGGPVAAPAAVLFSQTPWLGFHCYKCVPIRRGSKTGHTDTLLFPLPNGGTARVKQKLWPSVGRLESLRLLTRETGRSSIGGRNGG